MAQVLNGSFNTTAYGNRYLTFSWTATQDVPNNTTTVSWTLKGAGTASGYYMAGNFKVEFDGVEIYSSSTRIKLYNGTVVASGTRTFTHSDNGTKSFSARVEAGIYNVAVNCTGNGAWELRTIPRAATITSAPNFDDESTISVSVNNPANATTEMCISLDGNTDITVPYKRFTGATVQFTSADFKPLLQKINTNSRTVYFVLHTIIGSSHYYNSAGRTFTIKNPAPTLSISAVDTGGNSTTLTGAGGTKIINGFNVIKVSTGAAAKTGKEATIKSQSIKCGGQTINSGSGTFTNVTTSDGKVTFTATDSRNNTVTDYKTFTVIPYTNPTIKLAQNNVTTDGKFTISLVGTWFSGSFGAKDNALTVEYRWKVGNNEWGEWTAVTPKTNGNNWSFSGDKTGLDYQETYTVQARVSDTLRLLDSIYYSTEEYAAVSVPVFDWGKASFHHNTHVVVNNNSKIYGTDTDGTNLIAMIPCDANNNLEIGGGGYNAGKNATHIYGNILSLYYKQNLKINGKVLGDFVVQEGTSGIWRYRKWASGMAECWGTVTVTTTVDVAWGSLYVGKTKMSRQNYPFQFNSKPKEVATLQAGNGAAWLFAESGGNGVNGAYASAIYNVCKPTSDTSQTFYISIYAAGVLASS